MRGLEPGGMGKGGQAGSHRVSTQPAWSEVTTSHGTGQVGEEPCGDITGDSCTQAPADTGMPRWRGPQRCWAPSMLTWLLVGVLGVQGLGVATAGPALPMLLLLGTDAFHPVSGRRL
jgi:hypothetical protein